MTHRSPLVTLAGLVVAFAIMFSINIANNPTRRAARERIRVPVASATPSTEVQSPAATERPACGHADQDRNAGPGGRMSSHEDRLRRPDQGPR
jgi:hypothetical protein